MKMNRDVSSHRRNVVASDMVHTIVNGQVIAANYRQCNITKRLQHATCNMQSITEHATHSGETGKGEMKKRK
jgi:hypothetical protein